MASVPEYVKAGVTDLRAYLPVPEGIGPATEYLTEVVQKFNDRV